MVANGHRSGLEDANAERLRHFGAPVRYEEDKVEYTKPVSKHKYTPDFTMERPDGTKFFVETKGRFLPDDRQKHIAIKKSRPDIEVRFVFSNAKAKIAKGSKTTYAMWCEKHGFVWAEKLIPLEWIQEVFTMPEKQSRGASS
jgi:predicted nuclease of restriction endonuclease-like RecB superfamily